MGKIESVMAAVALLMRLRGFSQAELAERSGLSNSQLSRYLGGKAIPQMRQIFRLIDGLGVPGLAFWWTVDRVETIERVLAAGLEDADLLRGVLETILDDDGGHPGAATVRRLLDAARHSNAANRAILEVLAEEERRGDEPSSGAD